MATNPGEQRHIDVNVHHHLDETAEVIETYRAPCADERVTAVDVPTAGSGGTLSVDFELDSDDTSSVAAAMTAAFDLVQAMGLLED